MLSSLYMKRITVAGLFLFGASFFAAAQSKKELQAQLESLKTELSETKTELANARKREAAGDARVVTIQAELADLRQTNTNLLANLNKITEESSKKTASISESLTNIQRTERQMRAISDALTRIDSTTLGIVTDLKKTMGESAKIGISNNVVTIVLDNAQLYGENDQSYTLSPESRASLQKVADVLQKYPDTKLLVEGYANALNFTKGGPADNIELSALRAAAVGRVFTSDIGIKADRIMATGKGLEGMSIETTTRLHVRPNYEAFFKSIKDSVKN